MFFRYSDFTGSWGISRYVNDKGLEDINWLSSWFISYFSFSELSEQLKINEFSNVQLESIKTLSYKKYLTINPNIDFDIDKEIIFPDNIDELFYAYFRLNDEQKLIINNISSHISNSIELFHSKRTLSLLAAFTALETLINFEYMGVKIKNCCKCGLPEFKISEKFKDFLQKYVGTSAFNKKKFNSFYQLRSKIIHTGQQLKTEFLFNELSNEDRHSELVTRIEIIQMAKIAIMNWLLKRFK